MAPKAHSHSRSQPAVPARASKEQIPVVFTPAKRSVMPLVDAAFGIVCGDLIKRVHVAIVHGATSVDAARRRCKAASEKIDSLLSERMKDSNETAIDMTFAQFRSRWYAEHRHDAPLPLAREDVRNRVRTLVGLHPEFLKLDDAFHYAFLHLEERSGGERTVFAIMEDLARSGPADRKEPWRAFFATILEFLHEGATFRDGVPCRAQVAAFAADDAAPRPGETDGPVERALVITLVHGLNAPRHLAGHVSRVGSSSRVGGASRSGGVSRASRKSVHRPASRTIYDHKARVFVFERDDDIVRR